MTKNANTAVFTREATLAGSQKVAWVQAPIPGFRLAAPRLQFSRCRFGYWPNLWNANRS